MGGFSTIRLSLRRRNCGGGVPVWLPSPVAHGHAPDFSRSATGDHALTFSLRRYATHADKRSLSDQRIGKTSNTCEQSAQEGVGSGQICPGGLAKTRSGCTRPCVEHVSQRLVNQLRYPYGTRRTAKAARRGGETRKEGLE